MASAAAAVTLLSRVLGRRYAIHFVEMLIIRAAAVKSRRISYGFNGPVGMLVKKTDRILYLQTIDIFPGLASAEVLYQPRHRAFGKSAPLVKTTWNQGAPYNDLCPQKNGQITYTGCVATSTAQVMNYHQWPPQGTGTVSYDWNGQTLSMDFGATTFAWNDMLDSYPTATTGTDAQRQAVATLMKACGYALHMTYGLSEDGGSGAYSSDIANVLINNFSYDVTARYVQREFYSPEEWEQMIYDNLADIGPAIYGGHGSLGGHSFICDGYDTDGLFHINWGGTSDGYFRLSALDPPSLGAGGGAGGFNSQQNATLGIRKPQPGSVRPLPYIVCGGA